VGGVTSVYFSFLVRARLGCSIAQAGPGLKINWNLRAGSGRNFSALDISRCEQSNSVGHLVHAVYTTNGNTRSPCTFLHSF